MGKIVQSNDLACNDKFCRLELDWGNRRSRSALLQRRDPSNSSSPFSRRAAPDRQQS